MPDWLISIPAFVFAIGILVAVHEFGHFWVARRLGVRVLRYSIGFGSKLWGRTSAKTGTEYWIAAIPLGGYVKMLDEREGPVADEDKPYAFNRQSVAKRVAIVAAGPGINFLFAILAYWLVFMLGVSGIKPILGEVPADTPAAVAGLQAGDEVVSVAGEAIPTFQDLRLALLDQTLNGGSMSLTVVGASGMRRQAVVDLTGVSPEPEQLFAELGIQPKQPRGIPVIADVVAGSAAAAAGLQAGDRVVAAGGEPLTSARALVEWIRAHPGEEVQLTVVREGERQRVAVALHTMTTEAGETIGRLGAHIGVDVGEDWAAMQTTRRLGPLAAIPAAVAQTWSITSLTVRLLGQMVVGDVSWRNISGPIQIANYAGKTASIGLVAFLSFLALVSVSLAVLNLLPVPVLDGGHLLYYGVEAVRGRPLSEHAQAVGQQIGMAALLLLMSLAFYNDIVRLLG